MSTCLKAQLKACFMQGQNYLLGRWLSSSALKSWYRSPSGPTKTFAAVCSVSLRPRSPAFMSLMACKNMLKASFDSRARALHAIQHESRRIWHFCA